MGLLDMILPKQKTWAGFTQSNPAASWADQNPYALQGIGRTLSSVGQGMVGHASDTAGMFSGVNDALAAQQGPLGELALQQKQYAQQQQDVKQAQAQQSKTIKWLQSKGFADLADAVQNGAMTGAEAFKTALGQGSAADQETWYGTPQAFSVPGPDGKAITKVGIMSNRGNFKEVPFPENGSPVFPVQQLNQGTQFTAVDKYGRPTGITTPIDNSGKSFDEGVGKNGADLFKTYQTDAQGAYATLGQLSVMQQAMNDPNFYSGVGANAVLTAKRVIAAIGGDPDSVSSMETFNAASKKVILDGLGGTLGAQISDGDRQFIASTAPALTNTPAGNKQLIDIATKLANRKIAVADLASQYIQQRGSLDAQWPQFLAQWAQQNPLFSGSATPAPVQQTPGPAAPTLPPTGNKVMQFPNGITVEELP